MLFVFTRKEIINMYLLDNREKYQEKLKQEYLAELKKNETLLDKYFYKYASNPDNIIIDIRMECDIIVNYDAKLTIDYKEKEFNTRVKGINAEVRSNKIYLTADKTIDSNWEKKAKILNCLSRSFLTIKMAI